MKHCLVFLLLLVSTTVSNAQSPIDIRYNVTGQLNANELTPNEYAAAPKECVVDIHYSAASARIIMESLNGSVVYYDQIVPLEVEAYPDSTYVYGKPGAWTVGLGYYENVNEFRVKVLSANAQGPNPVSVAEGTYP